jgi:signal-transduction protein with cAMP-binding, CBS, and nucleotidyltransferase domain
VPYFFNFDSRVLNLVAQSLTLQRLRKEESLISKGDDVDAMFVVFKGDLKSAQQVYSKGSVILSHEVLPVEPRQASESIIACKDSILLRFAKSDF